MDKYIGRAGMVLIGWMVGTSCLWAEQTTLQDSWPKGKVTFVGQTVDGAGATNSLGLDEKNSVKSSKKKLKKSGGARKTSKKKGTKRKSPKKPKRSKSKKSKSGKSRTKLKLTF